MKKYEKPIILKQEFNITFNIASLSAWLSDNSLTDAGITTYIINS